MKALIAHNADATIGEKDGYTPMHGAGFQGRATMVPLLQAYGLDPNEMYVAVCVCAGWFEFGIWHARSHLQVVLFP